MQGRWRIESPLFQDLECQANQRVIRRLLEDRFGPVPEDVRQAFRSIFDQDRLWSLVRHERDCAIYDDFRALLTSTPG